MIGHVENAMLTRIAAASAAGAIGYTYLTLETFPKRFDELLSSQQVRFPACWTAFGGAGKVDRVRTGRWRAHCSFSLVVAAENLRNEQARRHGGSPSEPGSYQLAQDALRILGDQSLGLDIDAFRPASILPVETSDIPKLRQISMYAVTFETALYYDTAPIAADIDDFRTFRANWDPYPGGHVDADRGAEGGVEIPDDAHAIATDVVTLPVLEDA
jgi:phage gp37-like protein